MSNFSVVIGNRACNANCPFCISKQTNGCTDNVQFDWYRFFKAAKYVQNEHVNVALITGRGEPTLHTEQLADVVHKLNGYFPCIELQTNGILYLSQRRRMQELSWLGLNTIAFSLCSFDNAVNREVMQIRDKDFSIINTVQAALEDGFTVRLSLQMLRTNLDPKEQLVEYIEAAKQLNVHQITFRKIGKPDIVQEESIQVREWIDQYADSTEIKEYRQFFEDSKIKKIATYHWGGLVYSVDNLSVVLADCLTENPDTFDPRSWIFDGKNLRYSWQHKGAIVF